MFNLGEKIVLSIAAVGSIIFAACIKYTKKVYDNTYLDKYGMIANLIDIHNALHALGLRSDEQAEKFNKKHVMKLAEMYERRGYSITKK